MNRRDEIVAMADVTKLVCNHGLELCGRQTVEDAFGQDENGSEDAEDARFRESRGGHYLDWDVEIHGRSSADGATDATPADPPGTGDADESARPYR
jgi:hypothetical protein